MNISGKSYIYHGLHFFTSEERELKKILYNYKLIIVVKKHCRPLGEHLLVSQQGVVWAMFVTNNCWDFRQILNCDWDQERVGSDNKNCLDIIILMSVFFVGEVDTQTSTTWNLFRRIHRTMEKSDSKMNTKHSLMPHRQKKILQHNLN